MQALIDKYAANSPGQSRKLDKDEIVRRVLFPLVNEGFKILEEGIASDPSDIDVIYLYGYGWPAWRGEIASLPVLVPIVLLFLAIYDAIFTPKADPCFGRTIRLACPKY